MENVNYKVGDRIRVFEITQKGARHYREPQLKGLQRPELDINNPLNKWGVDLLTKDLVDDDFHFGIDKRNHAKHVATMVITKLK